MPISKHKSRLSSRKSKFQNFSSSFEYKMCQHVIYASTKKIFTYFSSFFFTTLYHLPYTHRDTHKKVSLPCVALYPWIDRHKHSPVICILYILWFIQQPSSSIGLIYSVSHSRELFKLDCECALNVLCMYTAFCADNDDDV